MAKQAAKPSTKAKENTNVEVTSVETVTEKVVEEPKKATSRPKNRKFDPTETFPCRSVCYGELILEGYKTKMIYTWANAGDYADVEFQDLQALQSRKSRFLTDPLFIIEDDELVEYWGSMLKPLYEKIENDNIEELLNLSPSELQNKLKTLPSGMKDSVKSMTAAKIMNGELDSINRIKVIDEVLGTDFITMIG